MLATEMVPAEAIPYVVSVIGAGVIALGAWSLKRNFATLENVINELRVEVKAFGATQQAHQTGQALLEQTVTGLREEIALARERHHEQQSTNTALGGRIILLEQRMVVVEERISDLREDTDPRGKAPR